MLSNPGPGRESRPSRRDVEGAVERREGRGDMMVSSVGSVRPRRWLRLLVGAMLVAVIAAPAAVFASHFTDVDPESTFFTNINNLAGAGITTGCAPTAYCPSEPVTREQMAAFLNRAAPRLSIAYFAHPLGNTPGQQPPNNAVVASTPVRAIGHEALLIRANFYTITYAGTGTFPCEVLYRFRVDGTLVGNPLMYHREIVVPANTWLTQPMTGEYAIVVPKGDHTVSLTYQRVTNSCSMYPGNGVLVVEPIPFRWDQGTYGFGLAEPAAGAPQQLEHLETVETLQSNGAPVE
jgi:hypothetical protein